MKVKAIKNGFYQRVRNEGDVFTLTTRLSKGSKSEKEDDIKKQFSENWMEEVSLVKTSAKLKVKR